MTFESLDVNIGSTVFHFKDSHVPGNVYDCIFKSYKAMSIIRQFCYLLFVKHPSNDIELQGLRLSQFVQCSTATGR